MSCPKCDDELNRQSTAERHLYDVYAGSEAELYAPDGQSTYLFSLDVNRLYQLLETRRGTDDARLVEWTASTGGRRIVPRHVGHLPSHARDIPGLAVVVPFRRRGDEDLDYVAVLVDGNHRLARARREGRPFFTYLLNSLAAQRALVYDR